MTCPVRGSASAARTLATDANGRTTAWLAALALVEHFDEAMPFALLDLAEPPPAELLDRLRRSWVDIPVTIYRHEGPLG